MGRSRKKGRDLDGVILVNKPTGASSNSILQKVRWIFDAKKAGHTGALDPLASGMLPVCFGNATKFAQFSLDADKTYEVTAKLGIRTTTSDADGDIVSTLPVDVSLTQLKTALDQFRGPIKQIPSMFSALKHQGKPLYFYARQGITIDRPARDITIYELHVQRFENDEVDMLVKCSKGTYIRSLVDDLGQALGCGAYVTRLHRTAVAGYPNLEMFTPEFLESLKTPDGFAQLDGLLLPTDKPIEHLPVVTIDSAQAEKFAHGQSLRCDDSELVAVEGSESRTVRVYRQVSEDNTTGKFLGIATTEKGQLQPKRLIS